MRNAVQLALIVLVSISMTCVHTVRPGEKEKARLKKEAVSKLEKVLTENHEWVKVHAAEYLIWSGYSSKVPEVFRQELEKYGNKPQYRIGIWRVLAQLSGTEERMQYVERIENAFTDISGSDRIHAVETLSKLKSPLLPDYRTEAIAALASENQSLSLYTRWNIGLTNPDSMAMAQRYFLDQSINPKINTLERSIASFILRNSGILPGNEWQHLQRSVMNLQADDPVRLSLLNTVLATAPAAEKEGENFRKIREQFNFYFIRLEKAARMEIASGLAIFGSIGDLHLLSSWMSSSPLGVREDDADVQATAAYAILSILAK